MTAKESRQAFYLKNKDRILLKKREYYHENKESICEKYRNDKLECHRCGILYRRSYLPKHFENRHKCEYNNVKSVDLVPHKL